MEILSVKEVLGVHEEWCAQFCKTEEAWWSPDAFVDELFIVVDSRQRVRDLVDEPLADEEKVAIQEYYTSE